MGGVIRTLAFPHPRREGRDQTCELENGEIIWLQTPNAGRTFALRAAHPSSRFTLLYTHGNAEDLRPSRTKLEDLRFMATKCGAHVFAVEYPGYSVSEAAQPSEQFCHEAAEAAWIHLVETCGLPTDSIVPFGRSLGTGPALHLAARHPEIKALILQSPLESGARAVFCRCASCCCCCLDIFKNYVKVNSVQARTCIIHGTDDEVVPCDNGRNLYASLEARGLAAEPLWMEGRGHNDMPCNEVYGHTNQFLQQLTTEPPFV